MFVENFEVTENWQEVSAVNDGNEYMIQNIGTTGVEYLVQNSMPVVDAKGGVIGIKQQLDFVRVDGNLYVRCFRPVRLHIESVE